MTLLVTLNAKLATAHDLVALDLLIGPVELQDLPGTTLGTLPHLLGVRVVLTLQHVELDTLHRPPGRDSVGVLLQEALYITITSSVEKQTI